nr:dihydroneopterin aldolase [Neoroseomonas eburnea]
MLEAVKTERDRGSRPVPLDAPTLDRMFLHGVEVRGRHGVFDFERRTGQRFVVDVDWWLDTGNAVAADRLDATVCYKQLYDCVVAVTAGEPWRLIETLADCLALTLLARFPAMAIVTVTVHKPEAPIGGVFADVGITMTRRRAGASMPMEQT